MACDYCKGSKIPGIHLPSGFDDREESRDGKVFVARCDECYDAVKGTGFVDDIAAADEVSRITGWPIMRSYDRDDAIDADDRACKEGYFRCYFAVTLAEVKKVHDGP